MRLLYGVALLYERSFAQVVDALLGADYRGEVVAFDFDNGIFETSFLGVVENRVESDHSAFAEFAFVLDVQELETLGILLEVVHGRFVASCSPVYVHFEEHEVGIRVFKQSYITLSSIFWYSWAWLW